MNIDRRDDIDRAIDEALASVTAEEPRRVNALSVRRAMGESRRSGSPVWLAIAAVLLVGLALALTSRTSRESRPAQVAAVPDTRVPESARPVPSPEPVQDEGISIPRSLVRQPIEAPADARWEGLARLAIVAIDLPEPLSTSSLETDPIQIPRIEIPPLSVFTLANEHNPQ